MAVVPFCSETGSCFFLTADDILISWHKNDISVKKHKNTKTQKHKNKNAIKQLHSNKKKTRRATVCRGQKAI
jgi:hypothetical protein